MAKWHYRIESNQRIKGYNHKNGTHDYLIQDVVKIEENGKARFEKEYYQNGGKSKFVNIGLSCILMLILLIYAIRNVQVSMDIESTNVFFYAIDNSINILGIILFFINFEPVAKIINPFFQLSSYGNKVYLLVIGSLLSTLLAGILYITKIGVPSTYLFSMLGILMTWFFS